ncbi:coagulation factor XI isoform X3 [Dicentrarchus labrax]|uniref:coagulation factor XI isoform X2 n=2 Tax=Dicentrarchus labrax TaxID=13489 RepID=UPI0021F5126B|nr:coagulation factor XI isoform X2 [Dicentrarchus labrax]XP_051247114.1 coagulation factor XI isoform X3 [Dicentrarchus labrax]
MITHFIVVGLLCGLSFSHECRRELLVNMDFPGTDITSVFSPDAEHCQHMCTQHSSCLFFSFLRSDWTGDNRHFYCYLKSTPSGKPNVQNPLLGITSGFSLKPCNPDLQPCLPQVYHHVDFPGADYQTLFTADYEECQRACTRDSACQFFTFLKQDFTSPTVRYKCHLKFSWPVPRIPEIIRLDTRISGFSQRMHITQNLNTECEGKLFPNTDIIISNIVVLPTASPEHCQTYCSAHPLCTYFTYTSHTFNCYLKHNPGEIVLKAVAGYTSGLPARFCQLDNNWIKKTYVGIDFPHNDIRNFLTSDVEACQRTCTEDPNCQYYSYITETSSDPAHRRRCYLKRVITMPAPPRVTKLTNAVSGFSLSNCHYKGMV